MFRTNAPIIVVPTMEAERALGASLLAAGQAAYREIAVAAKGLEISFLQFVFQGQTLAVCSRVRLSGMVEIELGLGDRTLPASIFTAEQSRQARNALRAGGRPRQTGRRACAL
jgi:hypothetical protein